MGVILCGCFPARTLVAIGCISCRPDDARATFVSPCRPVRRRSWSSALRTLHCRSDRPKIDNGSTRYNLVGEPTCLGALGGVFDSGGGHAALPNARNHGLPSTPPPPASIIGYIDPPPGIAGDGRQPSRPQRSPSAPHIPCLDTAERSDSYWSGLQGRRQLSASA